MKIVNLMPRDLVFYTDDGSIRYPRSIRNGPETTEKRKKIDEIAGIPVNEIYSAEVSNLPDPQEEIVYVVSPIVAAACSKRDDLYIPDRIVVDKDDLIGCRALSKAFPKALKPHL